MDKKEALRLSDALKESAISLGMCEQGIAGWLDYKSLDDLCEHYWEGIEFIINHPGWPSNKWLLDKVGITTLNKHDIYVEQNIEVKNPNRIVLNGTCKGRIFASDFSAPDIYVRHNSDIEVKITDASIAHINVYDNAKVKVHCGRFAKCYIYKYSGSVEADGEGKIVLRDKTKEHI